MKPIIEKKCPHCKGTYSIIQDSVIDGVDQYSDEDGFCPHCLEQVSIGIKEVTLC